MKTIRNAMRAVWCAAVLLGAQAASAQTGACCSNLGVCTTTTQVACTGGAFTFMGVGTMCLPNPCLAAVGACCASDQACTLTAAGGCISPSTFTTLGTPCSPNPCTPVSGACCIGTNCTVEASSSICTTSGGVFFPNQTCGTSSCTRPAIKISQIFTSGGSNGAPYKYDYVELHNSGATSVTMTNWTLQFGAQSTVTFPTRALVNGTIPAGGYFLIQLNSQNTLVGADLPTPDLTPAQVVNLDVAAGRLALVAFDSPLPNGCPNPFPVTIVDFVGYGPTGAGAPTCSEGGNPTGATGGVIYAWFRKGGGCQDTDSNGADFMLPGAPAPRNSSSNYLCGSTASGACCTGETCQTTADATACATLGGTFQGESTVCTPNNPCLQPRGACCNGASCTFDVQTNCLSPAIFSYGLMCSPDPCTGACCNGVTCTITTQAACISPAYWQSFTGCTPLPCSGPPVPVQSGDIAWGPSVAQARDAVPQIRGAGVAMPTRVGTWSVFAFMQGLRFDSYNGIQHNAAGNLLALNFGSAAVGGSICNLPTTTGNAAAGQLDFFKFTGASAPFGLQRSRLGGMSVNPANTRIAFLGYDSARAYVLSYVAAAGVGTGAGASIDGGAQTDNSSFLIGFNITQGTAWLDDDTLIVWARSELANTIRLWTIHVSGSGPGIMMDPPVIQLSIVDTKPNGSRFLGIAYNPQLIPGYIFLTSSDFQGVTTNTMYAVDITGGLGTWNVVKTIDLTGSLQTGREIAIGPDLDLYLNQFAGAGTVPSDPAIDKIDLNSNNDATVTAGEVAALADNSSVNFFLKGSVPNSNFSGMDIAVSLGACCNGITCTAATTPAGCAAGGGIYLGDNTTCTPNNCIGACCHSTALDLAHAVRCDGPVSLATCNAYAVHTFSANGNCTIVAGPPHVFCCPGNFNQDDIKNVADIFFMLTAWFQHLPAANWDGSAFPGEFNVGDIFSFLTSWFQPC